MNILVLGGTRFFGVHLVKQLTASGHTVTIATRGRTPDPFGDTVSRLTVDRTDPEAMIRVFAGLSYDVVYDDIAYCSNDVKSALDAIRCCRYILVSSISAYYELLPVLTESDLLPERGDLIWGNRADFPYDEGKRQAERTIVRHYPGQEAVMVRFPFIIGPDDYTQRLYFYVRNLIQGKPMHIDNLDSQMAFISSDEAGRFLSFLSASPLRGPVNACCRGTISLREIFAYLTEKTGKSPVLSPEGENAPYNGAGNYSQDTAKAEKAGYSFSVLDSWIYKLLDSYILMET